MKTLPLVKNNKIKIIIIKGGRRRRRRREEEEKRNGEGSFRFQVCKVLHTR
jgi:hypothetical protein